MDKTPVKFCKNCVYYDYNTYDRFSFFHLGPFFGAACIHQSNMKQSLEDGNCYPVHTAWYMRNGGKCGTSAKLFEIRNGQTGSIKPRESMTKIPQKLNCLSTHGLSGYAPGSYWKNGGIVCGMCGEQIHNPLPTGYLEVFYTFHEAIKSWRVFKMWIKGAPKEKRPTYPRWLP